MLSDNLASLAAHFRDYARFGGVVLSCDMCTLFAINLEADRQLALAMENRAGGVVRFDGSQPANVVPIDRHRIRAAFQPGLGQGGAA